MFSKTYFTNFIYRLTNFAPHSYYINMSTTNKQVFIVDTQDERLRYLKKYLSAEGYAVLNYLPEDTYEHRNDQEHIFIFPPYTAITQEIAQKLSEKCTVFAMRCFDSFAEQTLELKQITPVFYNDDETLLVQNAALTAEGTLAFVINNTPKSIKDLKVLVLGYGRVGKALVKIMTDNRAYTVAATNDRYEIALARVCAFEAYSVEEGLFRINEFDCVINTIPKLLLKGERLWQICKNVLIVDLASLPGGVDIDAAIHSGLNAHRLTGVPSKVAPKTAAKYLFESIKRALKLVKTYDNQT